MTPHAIGGKLIHRFGHAKVDHVVVTSRKLSFILAVSSNRVILQCMWCILPMVLFSTPSTSLSVLALADVMFTSWSSEGCMLLYGLTHGIGMWPVNVTNASSVGKVLSLVLVSHIHAEFRAKTASHYKWFAAKANIILLSHFHCVTLRDSTELCMHWRLINTQHA